ncbi:MAG: cytochrome C [Paludibacter sp.]
MKLKRIIRLFIVFILSGYSVSAQISPGELSNAHANLEGVSNCTKCHSTGNVVTREKCLACHKEIKANIDAKRGYHASAEVGTKLCSTCHNEHHGRNFLITRFDKKNFDHRKAGYELKGDHAKIECIACHKAAFIKDPEIRKKKGTYLGLSQECLSCHADYHQGKLSPNCATCHNFNSFKNATGFDHSKTRYPLLGKHKTVACVDCHKTEIVNGKTVQKFTSLQFNNCTPCHKDVHENRFGQNCKKCHSEESFLFSKSMKSFDHDKTNFKLIGKHQLVDCKACHKKSLTAPLKHDQCKDCHADFHKGDFTNRKGITPDCDQCHTNFGFTPSSFTIEKHNQTKFKLEGAHLASPCMACHKTQKEWHFKNMGNKCVDCHRDEHKGFIDEKFYPNENCVACHNVNSWKTITFDHDKTGYKLVGAHATASCSSCHYRNNENGIRTQLFAGTSKECSSCHKDSHVGQFEVKGKTDCTRCHGFDKWENSIFDHNTSRFKIDGGHIGVECIECHKPVMDDKGKYIQYKFKSIECKVCHS